MGPQQNKLLLYPGRHCWRQTHCFVFFLLYILLGVKSVSLQKILEYYVNIRKTVTILVANLGLRVIICKQNF